MERTLSFKSKQEIDSEIELQFDLVYRNMHMITEPTVIGGFDSLWLGDYSAALDRKTLERKGIRTVLTTAHGLSLSYPPSSKIFHKEWNFQDHPSFDISSSFDAVIQEIANGLKRGGVLVHCAAGISRSSSCVIAYLMSTKSISLATALQFVRSKRRVVQPNSGFLRQLTDFEKKISLSRKRPSALQAQPVRPQSQNMSTRDLIQRQQQNYQNKPNFVKTFSQASIRNPSRNESLSSIAKQQRKPLIGQASMNTNKLINGVSSETNETQGNEVLPVKKQDRMLDDEFILEQMHILKQKSNRAVFKSNQYPIQARLLTREVETEFMTNTKENAIRSNRLSSPTTMTATSTTTVFDKLYSQQLKLKTANSFSLLRLNPPSTGLAKTNTGITFQKQQLRTLHHEK